MVDPVCVHGCDPGHVSPVSDSCSPAGYPHVAEVFSLSFVFSLPLWYDLRCCGITFGDLIVSARFCVVLLIRGTVQLRLILHWVAVHFRYHAGTFA
jgi:hypothetical protein